MNKNPIKYGIIIAIIILMFCGIYFLISNLKKNEMSKDYVYLKNYEVNEYIPTYISDENMASIYLSDFIYNMYYNVENAYNLLNEEYRINKFGNIESFKNYVNNLNFETPVLKTYYVKNTGKYIVYGVTDTKGKFYAFETNGVMQYSVYLDDYTVEIW